MQVLRPKRPRWLIAFAVAAAVCLAAYLALSAWRPWVPGAGAGLVFGILASLIFLIDLLYPLRRRLLGWPFGTAQRWLQFHIYGGLLAALCVGIHAGFRWPSGTMGWFLEILTVWVTLSGLAGVWLQKWIPALTAGGLQVEALLERIPKHLADLQKESEALVAGSSEMLERFYGENVRPAMAGIAPSLGYLIDVRSERDRRLGPFNRLAPFLGAEERPRLDDLKSLLTEKLELDAQYSLQRILRLWTWVHVPPSALLFGLMLFHIFAGLYYT
ncbi:MAG TPA: hypothetical protein VGK26_10230 [Thermoanaerobaculia bacterium]|jgi:hypothetical protein